jgi:hypothetical protein
MTVHMPNNAGIDWVTLYSEPSGVLCQALIRNATKGAIKLWLERKLVTGAGVQVTFAPGFKETGTVLYCRPDGGGYKAVITLQPLEGGRRETRTDMHEPCVVRELGVEGAQALSAEVINMSRSGMGLRSKNIIQAGALVSIALENFIFIAEVRHCTADSTGQYRIGVSIEHQTPRTSKSNGKATELEGSHPFREWVSKGIARIFWGK